MAETPKRARAPRPARQDPAAAVLGVVDTAAVAARLRVSPQAVQQWVSGSTSGPEALREPAGVLNGGFVWPEAALDAAKTERERGRSASPAD
ncbi:MAG: hypothetical protein K0R97_3237 [Oerskovia sp.]|jgi:hypothetical protein|nr:hypothetical protein [Oerskovia sp.]